MDAPRQPSFSLRLIATVAMILGGVVASVRTFRVARGRELECAEVNFVAALTAARRAAPLRFTGNALISEDGEPIRVIAGQMLQTFGYTALGARDGTAGLVDFRERTANWALVLLDLLMPGLSGEDTLVALRAARPDVRVLLISGYNERNRLRRLGVLQKAFSRDTLLPKLREMLR
jgi:CheY-like chemotaxis protein